MSEFNKIERQVGVDPHGIPVQEELGYNRIRQLQQIAKDMVISDKLQRLQIDAFNNLVATTHTEKTELEEQQIVPVLEVPEEPTVQEVYRQIRDFEKMMHEFHKCLADKKEGCDESTEIAYEMIRHTQKLQKMLHEDYMKVSDQLIERAKASKVLSWVSTAATIVTTGLAIGISAITLATGGVGAALYSLQGAAMVVKGGIMIAEAALNYVQKKQQGDLTLIRADKEHHKHLTKIHHEAALHSISSIPMIASVQSQIEKRRHQAIKSITR